MTTTNLCNFHKSKIFYLLNILILSITAFADHSSYSGQVKLEKFAGKIYIIHTHDYSSKMMKSRLLTQKTPCSIFDTLNTYSKIQISIDSGLTWKISPAPPLSNIVIDTINNKIIGLSQIKYHNHLQIAVYKFDGSLEFSASVSESSVGLANSEFRLLSSPNESILKKLKILFRNSDSTYFEFPKTLDPNSDAKHFLLSHLSNNPILPNANETVSNFVNWYNDTAVDAAITTKTNSIYLKILDQNSVYRFIPLDHGCNP